jgi:hypothetical protein
MPTGNIGELLVRIDIRLQQLGWIRTTRTGDERHIIVEHPPLLAWARSAIERSGIDIEAVDALLDKTHPDRHWWLLRQFLPVGALQSLDRRLEQLINEQTQNNAH